MIRATITNAQGRVIPFSMSNLGDVQEALNALRNINLELLRFGVPLFNQTEALKRGFWYQPDPKEHWKNAREVNFDLGGDCEDLTGYFSAGMECFPKAIKVSGSLIHCVCEYPNGLIFDPSAMLGMPMLPRKRNSHHGKRESF